MWSQTELAGAADEIATRHKAVLELVHAVKDTAARGYGNKGTKEKVLAYKPRRTNQQIKFDLQQAANVKVAVDAAFIECVQKYDEAKTSGTNAKRFLSKRTLLLLLISHR